MGRITEYIAYLNSEKESIDKAFTHLTITDKIAQERNEIIARKNKEKTATHSLIAEKGKV